MLKPFRAVLGWLMKPLKSLLKRFQHLRRTGDKACVGPLFFSGENAVFLVFSENDGHAATEGIIAVNTASLVPILLIANFPWPRRVLDRAHGSTCDSIHAPESVTTTAKAATLR